MTNLILPFRCSRPILPGASERQYGGQSQRSARNNLIFSRRLWANRVIKKAGFPIRSREAKLLIDLLMRASKKSSKGLPTAEQVLFSALRMFHDKNAVAKVAKGLAVSPLAAERALAKLPNAAITLASENRMRQFVDVANRIHLP
jgi:hypothetical protein